MLVCGAVAGGSSERESTEVVWGYNSGQRLSVND
ncbi:hypothetical protein CASFOL_032127 [Castilleja foliolosa]|uniref:MHC class I antigen n=1 Tax=Castilleja foliolosa TaxID=1961234 RepID=A0ABD3C1R3_9LAMI